MSTQDVISVEELVKKAKKEGVDFGDTDPYNRLRYYTKIGWLPHMVRKTDEAGSITGHYPTWALRNLLLIEKLKKQGLPNATISKRITTSSKIQNVLSTLIAAKKDKYRFLTYGLFVLFLVVIAGEINIIPLGSDKGTLTNAITKGIPFQINDSGIGVLLKNQRRIFVRSAAAKVTSKVYVTFRQNYSPATRYWVTTATEQNGFTIELDAPVSQDAEFSWWISQ